jgi:hypothetical protein
MPHVQTTTYPGAVDRLSGMCRHCPDRLACIFMYRARQLPRSCTAVDDQLHMCVAAVEGFMGSGLGGVSDQAVQVGLALRGHAQ